MPAIELAQDQINYLERIAKENLQKAQGELDPQRPAEREALAWNWDVWNTLLNASTNPGMRSEHNPYR